MRGTGLGLSIVKSIFEIHGGHISVYTKNIMGDDNHGLVFDISLPIYEQTTFQKPERKDNIIFIKQGIENLSSAIKVFQNVSVTPHIFQSVKDLIDEKNLCNSETNIVASPESINQIQDRLGTICNMHTFLQSTRHGHLIINDSDKGNLQIFSESYVIANLLKFPAQKSTRRQQATAVEQDHSESLIS